MDHLLVRVGGRQVLVVDVCSSDDGQGVGYGIILKRIDKALWRARLMNAALFYVREARSINTAVFRLRSDDVEIVPRFGWRALWLRCVWVATSAFRHGRTPSLWVQRVAARTLLGPVYETIERSRFVPGFIRRLVVRPRPIYRRLKRASVRYGDLSVEAWRETFRPVERQIRRNAREGKTVERRLSLPPGRERQAIAEASALGIHPDHPLITVHVREPGYRAVAGLRQRPLDRLRNATVESYFEAFDALVERGYTVVRLGDLTMTPVDRRGVVDVATLPRRSEWLETWCVLRSRFLIGIDSGPSWLAFLLGVPVLTVNALHFRDVLRPVDRMICKLVRERETGRQLSISEMLTESYLRTGLDTQKYEHLDNEPADIRAAAVDMIDVVEGRQDRSPAQQRFNGRLVELGRDLPRDWTGLEAVACVRRPVGTLSRPFAEKYL